METQIDLYSGERLTFMDFFVKKNYKIEIPIIQRDYAQGRKSSGEIREVFLDTLYAYLEEGKPNRDLDFVYGSILKDDNNNKTFIPLDGQQRLTTLFLLHWYLAAASGNSKIFRTDVVLNDHSRFGYETRTSSREFCDALVLNDIDMLKLLKPDSGKNNAFSKTIRDKGWYYLSWENDPTIKSMMTMLDAIHAKFNSRPDFYDKLTDKTNPVITLLSLDLREFKLTDDLYIKMNSRGKPLTPFENFKAKFEQHISRISWPDSGNYVIAHEDGEKAVLREDYFSHQIDTAWADLFWNYRNQKSEYSSFDKELMSFIRVIVSSSYALEKSANKDLTLEYLFGTQVVTKKPDYTDNLSYHRYQGLGVLLPRVVTFLIDAFDALVNGTDRIKIHLLRKDYYDEEEVFKKVLDHSVNLEQRVQFYAYVSYLITNGADMGGIDQWMRVIHNLTLNTIIDSAEDVARAIGAVEFLLPGSKDILSHLISIKATDVDFFYRRQIQEEQLKARLIKKSEKWQLLIEKTEKHSYFLGQIMFLFEFAGVLAYYETKHNTDWDSDSDDLNYQKFKDYALKAGAVFDTVGTALNKGFGWERAVLTKGDYMVAASQRRYNFLSTNRFHRDYSWKRFLRLPSYFGTNADESAYLEKQRSYVKAVFDDELFHPDNLEESFKAICKNKPEDWRKYFIGKPALIGYCGQGFIRYESEHSIYLYKQSQQNHYQAELYTYDLYLREMKDKGLDYPFENWGYKEVRTGDEQPAIHFENYLYKAKTYRMEIIYDSLIQEFEFTFNKTKGDKKKENFDDKIIAFLEDQDFEWIDQEIGFIHHVKGAKKTLDLINDISRFLSELKNS